MLNIFTNIIKSALTRHIVGYIVEIFMMNGWCETLVLSKLVIVSTIKFTTFGIHFCCFVICCLKLIFVKNFIGVNLYKLYTYWNFGRKDFTDFQRICWHHFLWNFDLHPKNMLDNCINNDRTIFIAEDSAVVVTINNIFGIRVVR